MANNRENNSRRGRRRRVGVPVALVVVLLIIALLMGGLGGFVVARRTDTHVHELQAANERVTELENTLTMIGYPVGDDVDPQQWVYDSTANDTALRDLSGEGWDEDAEDDLWIEASLLDGTLPETADPVVVAEFEGGQLLSSEVIPEYNDRLTTLIFAGHDANEVAEETLNSVLTELTGDKIIAQRASELGLTELTEADLAEIDRQAAESYEAQLSDYLAFAGEEGLTREEAAQRLETESGITPESVADSLKQRWWAQKFFDYIVQDVTVSDEEVQAHYDALLDDQRKSFDSFPVDFEYAHQTGELIVYRPEGYRAVRDILIGFTDDGDVQTAAALLAQLELDGVEEGAQEQLDALYASLEKTASEAEERLAGGAAFADLMDEYGCDPELREEPLRSEGYYISSESYVNSAEYVEGAMMLEQPGQVSPPLRSEFGLHLVEYIGDVTPGPIPLEDVLDAVRADALKEKQEQYYAQQRQALLDAAQVKYYPERLR